MTMTISRQNAQLAQTINVNSTAIGDTISIPSSGIVNISGVLNVSGVQVSVSGHPHVSTDISDWTEAVQDVIGASGFLVGQSGISISYSDGSNILTITGSGGGGAANKILSDVSGSTNYIGIAPSGSATSATIWTIYRTIYNSGGSVTSDLSAVNVAWDNRYTETYS